MSKKLFFLMALVLLLGLGLTNVGNAFTPPSPPNWTLEIISWPLVKAYPGIEYNIRLGVIGGRYPYSFSLVDAPAGMTITSDKGEISWTPDTGLEGQSFDVSVKVVDQLSQEVYQNFSVSVTKIGFYFIATNGSDSTGDGSIGNPWATMSYAVTQGSTADILYVRGGTYIGRIIVSNGNINKWIAYPGEQPTFNLNQENPYTDGVVDEYAYIDGFEVINAQTKGFFCQAGHLIARRNHMHHLYTDGPGLNPAFIFWPIGYEEYNVIQDNIFHDLFSENDHGASVIFYDVRYSLYEDNEAYNIEGRGVGDKDGGYHNTFRNNVLHDTTAGGVRLESQSGQDQLEVSYNLSYNTGSEGLVIGWQPGYTRDVYVHHNTIVDGPIRFRDALNDPATDNINIYNNIVINGDSWLYACYPTVEGLVLADNIVHVDNNLLWTTGSYVFGYGYTTTLLTFAEWQSYGKDLNGILDDPQLDANYNLPPGSPYFGIYGREIDTGGAPGQASNPSPANSATDISVDADLSWSAGSGATSHDVYFGTDSTPDSGEFEGNQTTTTFEPGTMLNDTTYYWRIDEINAEGTTTGTVWNFMTESGATPPGQPSNPSPADNATDISINADLSWTAGSGATSHDVYFGTDLTPDSGEFQGNQTATTFDPGTMANDTTYYWRVDEINAVGTTTGNVWNFTTVAAGETIKINFQPAASQVPAGYEPDSGAAYGDRGNGLTYGWDATVTQTRDRGVDPDQRYDTLNHMQLGGEYTWEIGLANGTYDLWLVFGDPVFADTINTIDVEGTVCTDPDGQDNFDEYNIQVGVTDGRLTISPAAGSSNAKICFIEITPVGATLPGQASNPSPADSATDVSINADLSWSAGSGATSHDVYFGTSSPGSSQGNQTATTFDTGTMNNNTTYYWRIDEVNAAGTTTGTVWSFTTIVAVPSQATNPSPADSATSVSTTADLSWTAGSGTTSHDVYFGTSSPGSFQGNQTETTFDAGAMANNTTYYWRIDEINAGGTTTGTVWNFTTIVAAPSQATNPNPADSATGVSTTADLSWTAGSGATSHDVYFGTSSPGTFQGNQAATTFDTATMANNTTYYWRIDEVSAGGTTTGTVWSFTTIVAAPAQASNPSPANSATDVSITTDLSWTAGSGATSHDVYFGTSSPGSFQGNQTATTFDTGTMTNDTTYYWRIDEVNAGGTTTGTVWSFTTIVAAPGQASSPSPANSATGVSITADLSWTACSGATSHDVYFGTSSPGSFQGNQTATTFDTGTMTNDTTYYWRIDEVNAGGTTNGAVWSFTTIVGAPAQATNPSPANSATNVSITADLSWTAGSGATSHDVYFGTSSPGSFQGNQTATTFDTGTMTNDTTYYWRIDEMNAGGTTTGNVWTFTTVTAGQPVTEEFGDAVNTDHPGTVEDTFTNAGSSGGVNYSTNVLLSVYTWPADTIANTTIIKWDLSAIPTDATVTEATLYLYQTESGGDTSYDVPVHKIINVNPVISTCTWNTYDGTNSWTAGADGGQGDTAAAEDTQVVDSTNNVYKTWSVTNMVQAWVSSASSNYGMLLNSDPVASVDSYRYFASTQDSNTSNRPKLIATYIAGTPGQATNPDPNDTETDVTVDAVLSWNAGSGATSHDVYFGTSSPGSFQGNQTQTSFDPGTLSYDITYYWRIDEINAAGTTTGNVWTFTTEEAPQPPGQATNPGPADTATNVDVDADLSWTAGTGSTSSDVYFGTTSPGTFQGNQTETSFDPGTMDNDTTYYWRIDEINTDGTTTGNVWSFTTIVAAPGQASNPSPADTATDVDVDADLSWTAGTGSTSSDVYFGTTSPGNFQGNQTATTFDPGTMANDTTYYWRIDEINAGGTTTGTVWSFTTIVATPSQATNPSPADSATDVDINAVLSWTAGSGSTSSDVYFGTTSPGTFQGNQTATTFDPGTMAYDTTYYWRIDEVNAGGTTTGNVWNFTTIVSVGDEIIGWWALDEGTGSTAADSTAYGNDGTLVGSLTWTNDAERSWCLDFSGDDNYVTIPNESFFDIIGNITVMAWMKDNYTDWRNLSTIIAMQKARRTNAMSFYVDVSGMPWDGIKAGVGIFDNQWHHVAGVYDGSNAYIYIDGGQDSNSIACSGSMATNDWDVYIGENSQSLDGGSNGREWDGLLSNVRLYNYALTQSEVNDIYTGGAPSPPGQATNPSPADSAADVNVDADLSWTSGTDSTSSDVYFGTTSPGTFQGNQTATTFEPGTMSNDTIYYWRIDEINAAGTTTGVVWSFTTVAASSDVEIIGSWVSGTSHTAESGTNRALIFIAHAESSADTSDLGSVTYGGQSMTKVVERNMHSSYSAYTCAFILDEDGIDAATSGTFSPSWDTSPSGTPAYTSVFLQNVNQTTLTGATGTGGTTTTTAATSALSNNDGDMAIVAGTCGNDAAYTTINSFTEAIEVAPSSADGIGGYIECTGANVTPGVSHTNVNRQSVIGFVVQAE